MVLLYHVYNVLDRYYYFIVIIRVYMYIAWLVYLDVNASIRTVFIATDFYIAGNHERKDMFCIFSSQNDCVYINYTVFLVIAVDR